MTNAEREPMDQAVLEIIKQVASQPFSNGKIRFCAENNEVWETSPTASCESTRSTSVRHEWPLPLTSASEPFGWIAYSRFFAEFCRAGRDDSLCSKLGLGNAPDFKIENLDGARLNESVFDRLTGAIARWLLPAAWADVSELPPPDVAPMRFEVCKVQDGEMTSRSGAKIFFDFGPQPSPAHSKLLSQTAVVAADTTISEVAVNDGLTKLTAMGKPILVSYNTKTPWVKERFAKDKATWIGVEKTVAELGDTNGQKFASAYDQLKSQLKARRALSPKVQDAMTAGICPGAGPCVWLQNDKVRKSVALFPLESEPLKLEQLILERKTKFTFDELEALVTAKRLTPDQLTILRREYANLLLASEIPSVGTRNRLRRLFSLPEVSKAMVELVDGVIAMKTNRLAQDRAIAEAALARGGVGIVSLQNTRRDGIIAAFEDVCEGPKPAPVLKGKAAPKVRSSKPVAKPAASQKPTVR